jgi:hypothetical protein
MPTPRKSCLRCHADKARCSYISRYQSCIRCIQKKIACELPVGSRRFAQAAEEDNDELTASSSYTHQSQSQTAALNSRIDKVEKLLADLKGSLPVSSSTANGGHRQIDEPTTAAPSIHLSRVDHTPTAGLSNKPSPSACSLPLLEDGQALLSEYLCNFNSRIPLLAPEAIVSHMRECYSGAAKRVPSSWILTFLVFGIAHRLRALDQSKRQDSTSQAEHYLDRCLDNFSKVLLEEPNERIVQCLLGTAILLQGSDKSHRVASFVAIAMQMAQELGYNEACMSGSKNPSQIKVENNVFWIAFYMDADLSMCALKPITQKHTDIMIELPSVHNDDSRAMSSDGIASGTGSPPGISFFFLHASLAVIQAQALEEVFSPRANSQPTQQSIAVHAIMTKLSRWREHSKLTSHDGFPVFDLLHLATLEAAYFRTLYQLLAAQQTASFTYRQDLFSHITLRAQRHARPSAFYDDATRLLSLLALLPAEIASVNR